MTLHPEWLFGVSPSEATPGALSYAKAVSELAGRNSADTGRAANLQVAVTATLV